MSNREKASSVLANADELCGDAKTAMYPATAALVGIGFALLEVADAIREKAANEVTMTDLNAWTDRWIRTQIAAQEAAAQPPRADRDTSEGKS